MYFIKFGFLENLEDCDVWGRVSNLLCKMPTMSTWLSEQASSRGESIVEIKSCPFQPTIRASRGKKISIVSRSSTYHPTVPEMLK